MPIVDTDRLQSVARYARNYPGRKKTGVAVGYIYQLIKEGKLEHVEIDGIYFIVLPSPTT
ncbi:hypothetical protein [Hymenobacter sp. BT491]|uniref:hypothetical protein n=1 Tax=Hymenobacter sp. BT491 TaxID=2766779 RepID=UPI0016536571|nr:hypothetical protein [Hymenobacter sp. BT491]MBC6988969.1 hypothetical protein [Hymenobacter sp. BT491]